MESASACAIQSKDVKVEGPVKKLVRRVVQQIQPTHALVRYDTLHQKWAVLDTNYYTVRHFEYGVMSQVTFKPVYLYGGCGSTSSHIGVATGLLQENTYGDQAGQWENLNFKDNNFHNANGRIITQANRLILMPERRAVFQA